MSESRLKEVGDDRTDVRRDTEDNLGTADEGNGDNMNEIKGIGRLEN